MDETFLLTNIAPQVGDGFNRLCVAIIKRIPRTANWAYLEDWCRRLPGTFQDVYVFTVPLYLPNQGPDGKWRMVSIFLYSLLFCVLKVRKDL